MKIIHQIRLLCLLSLILVFTACERQVYTTWECSGIFPDKHKFSFILDGSNMKFQGTRELKFCGSLGNSSFFDEVCPAQIEKSKVIFIPKKGDFIEDLHAYRCFAL